MRKPLIAALATAATLLAAGAAQAGGNVQWSVGVNLPNVATVISNFPFPVLPTVVVQQAPVVYSQPQVVYQPAPRVIYERPVVYQQPVVVYQQPVVSQPVPMVYGRDRDCDENGVSYRHDRHDNRGRHARGYGDRDHDGVPDRYDRVDNRYYSDQNRNGVPDRYEARDDRKYRH